MDDFEFRRIALECSARHYAGLSMGSPNQVAIQMIGLAQQLEEYLRTGKKAPTR